MPLIFKDDKLLFVSGALAMSEDCCCEDDTPKVCGDCGMSATSQFQVTVPGVGTFTLTNFTYSAGTNCHWSVSFGFSATCGDVESVVVHYSSTNGGWTVSVQFSNGGFSSGVYRSATNEQFLGCGPWTVDCPQFFGSFGACARTTPASYTVTVTLIP
jgi:hypothetical protein